MAAHVVCLAVDPLTVRQVGKADVGMAGPTARAVNQGGDDNRESIGGETPCKLILERDAGRKPGDLLGCLIGIGIRAVVPHRGRVVPRASSAQPQCLGSSSATGSSCHAPAG